MRKEVLICDGCHSCLAFKNDGDGKWLCWKCMSKSTAPIAVDSCPPEQLEAPGEAAPGPAPETVMQVYCFGCGRKSPVQDKPTVLCPVCCCVPKFKAYWQWLRESGQKQNAAEDRFLRATLAEDGQPVSAGGPPFRSLAEIAVSPDKVETPESVMQVYCRVYLLWWRGNYDKYLLGVYSSAEAADAAKAFYLSHRPYAHSGYFDPVEPIGIDEHLAGWLTQPMT